MKTREQMQEELKQFTQAHAEHRRSAAEHELAAVRLEGAIRYLEEALRPEPATPADQPEA